MHLLDKNVNWMHLVYLNLRELSRPIVQRYISIYRIGVRSYCYSIVINNNNNNKKVIVIDNNNKKSYCYLITITFLLFVINNKKITNNFFFWKILVLLYNYVETYQFYLLMVLRLLGDDTDHNFNYIAYETLKTPKWSFRVFVSHTTEIHWLLYKGRFPNARSSLMWCLGHI